MKSGSPSFEHVSYRNDYLLPRQRSLKQGMRRNEGNPFMGTELRFLILEDTVADAELCEQALRRAELHFASRRVATGPAFEAALDQFAPDLIISDFHLPGFDGMTALEIARRKHPEIPFIFFSGTIGEHRAVEAMKLGATDYVLKDRMDRLIPIVKRALHEAEERTARHRAEDEISRQRAFLRQVIDLAPIFIFAKDRDGRFVLANQALADAYGSTVEQLLGKTDADFNSNSEEVEHFRRMDLQVMDTLREEVIPEEVITDATGRVRWLQTIKRAIVSENGTANMVLGVATDITARKLQEQKIEKLLRVRTFSSEMNAAIVRIHERQALLEEACRIATEHGKFELVWIASLNSERQEIRPVAWTGFSPQAVHAMNWATISAAGGTLGEAVLTRKPAVRNDIEAELATDKLWQEALKAGCHSTVCLPLVVDDNIVAAVNLFAAGQGFFDESELALLNEIAADLSFALQSIARQQKLEYLSYYDTLTGLPNRQLFIDRLSQQMRARSGESPMVTLILFDLERFRNVNESLGRHGGDELLKEVARRLERTFHNDHLARISADSFGVMVRDVRDAPSVAHIIENQVQGLCTEPFSVGGKELRLAAKVGVAVFPADAGDADTLFGNAEMALKKAKNSGERYLFYAADMNAQAAQALSLETRLRKAVDAQQFVLHYQPKIGLATGRICGLEALIRWQDPESGLVAPGAFIPLLEETGLILEVGRWALTRAMADYREWTACGRTVPRIAVNVSAIQLQQKDFAAIVTDAVLQVGEFFRALELEITESLLMKDVETSIRKLSTLRDSGISIAMDDFGTGYSSLSYLARLPIDMVKIDRSFIRGIANNTQDMSIVTTIIALAHSLNLRVVAEGVETEEQAQLLRILKCDEAQGYLFSRPLPATDVEKKLGARAASE